MIQWFIVHEKIYQRQIILKIIWNRGFFEWKNTTLEIMSTHFFRKVKHCSNNSVAILLTKQKWIAIEKLESIVETMFELFFINYSKLNRHERIPHSSILHGMKSFGDRIDVVCCRCLIEQQTTATYNSIFKNASKYFESISWFDQAKCFANFWLLTHDDKNRKYWHSIQYSWIAFLDFVNFSFI